MKNDKTVDQIIELFLSPPRQEREEVIHAVKSNPYFCFECGYGSKESPNDWCQCWNDE